MHPMRSSTFPTSIGGLSRFVCSLRSWAGKGFRVSRFQSFKVSRFQGFRVSRLGASGARARFCLEEEEMLFGAALGRVATLRVCILARVGIVALMVVGAGAAMTGPFGNWRRASETPIISPRGNSWESAGTFNPAVVVRDGKFVMLYRAQDQAGTSRLGYAESSDGIHFTRRDEPVFSPEEPYEKDGG